MSNPRSSSVPPEVRADVGSRISRGGALGILLTGLLLLGGCKLGPEYSRPALWDKQSEPASFSTPATAGVEWKTAEPAAHWPRGPWWNVFADPELDCLVVLATSNSLDVAAAIARFDAARASVKLTRADLLPQLEIDPSYSRQRTSLNAPQNGHAAGVSPTFNTFTLPLQAGWEADLWGRVRREVESSQALVKVSAADFENVKLAVQAEVATDYFSVRALDAECDLVTRSIASYRRSLELTSNRRSGGIATEFDVAQAETQLRATEALLPALQLQRASLVHALATLCGQLATGFDLPSTHSESWAVPRVPSVLPSELLERRPDVAAVEQRMVSANARIGVAQSAFYPRIRLSGVAGLQSLDAATWFDWPSRLWAVGPSLQLPLFTGGRNRAQLALARAAYNESVANYRQTVLNAFQEVEDQIAAEALLDAELQAETAAVEAARRTVAIATNRYKAGLVTYLEVANAQRLALELERTVVQIQGRRSLAAVALVRALGGGWQNRL